MFTVRSRLEKQEGWLRVLGIDPSTSNMGISIVDVNVLQCEKFQLVYSNTIFGDKVSFSIPDQFNDTDFTGVEARCYGLARSFKQLSELYLPDTAICEDNFLGVSAGTFKELIKCVNLLREFANKNDIHMSFVLPNLAKEIVGANFRGTTKEDVMRGIQEYSWLDSTGIDLASLDEHSADSLAVTLYRCEQIAKHYKVQRHGDNG